MRFQEQESEGATPTHAPYRPDLRDGIGNMNKHRFTFVEQYQSIVKHPREIQPARGMRILLAWQAKSGGRATEVAHHQVYMSHLRLWTLRGYDGGLVDGIASGAIIKMQIRAEVAWIM